MYASGASAIVQSILKKYEGIQSIRSAGRILRVQWKERFRCSGYGDKAGNGVNHSCPSHHNVIQDDYAYSILYIRLSKNQWSSYYRAYWITRCWQCHLKWFSQHTEQEWFSLPPGDDGKATESFDGAEYNRRRRLEGKLKEIDKRSHKKYAMSRRK